MTCQMCDNCKFEDRDRCEDIYHEIHITVDHRDTFVDDCYSLGIKPIIIDMGEGVPQHSMTSTSLKNVDDTSVLSWANHMAQSFKDKGYEVTRVKIETTPWHPKALNPLPHQYFEAHIGVKVDGDIEDYFSGSEDLKILSKLLDLHYSKNLLKRGAKNVQMLTYRNSSVGVETFLAHVKMIETTLINQGFDIEKVITEFALYDTNIEMDNQWLKKS